MNGPPEVCGALSKSRFPAGMTNKKANADSYGMTNKENKAKPDQITHDSMNGPPES
jgi:hypothetical protein